VATGRSAPSSDSLREGGAQSGRQSARGTAYTASRPIT
jgi:hypothetical protein